MKIIRFIDDHGVTRYGIPLEEQAATVLEGDPLHGLIPTEQVAAIHQHLAPIEPRAILCIGLNYRAHAEETGAAIPDRPVLFMKNPASLNHPGAPIVLPAGTIETPEVDYECELAVIIGRAAKNISVDQALDYVLGYTIANDVSARIWQKSRGGAGQWIRGKSFDTFCPAGPCLITADQIPDPQQLRLTTTLNGEVVQDGHTSDMIFTVAEIIAEISKDMTLLPGTLLLTGTPSGVGVARSPQLFLKPGDRLTCTIDAIGDLSNHVVG